MLARITTGFLVATLLVVVACGSDEARDATQTMSATATSADRSTPQALPTNSDSSLEKGLLAAADLGAGWTDPGRSGATVAWNYLCDTEVTLVSPDVSVFLVHPDDRRLLFESILKFSSVKEAQEPMQVFREAARTCGSYVSTDGVAKTEWHVTETALDERGDESLALIATTPDVYRGSAATAYFVLIRRGNVVAFVGDVTPGEPDRSATEVLVGKADAKFELLRPQSP